MNGQHPQHYTNRPALDWTERLVTGKGKIARRAPLPRPDRPERRLTEELDTTKPGQAFMRLVRLAMNASYRGLTDSDRVAAVDKAYQIIKIKAPGFTRQDANFALATAGLTINI